MAAAWSGMEQLPKWRWDSQLGSGGFGAVFKVWEEEAGRHYAVKLVPLSSRKQRDKVQGEVKALAGLSDVEGVVNYCHSWFVDFDSDAEFNDFKQRLQQQCGTSIHLSECLSACSSGTSAADSVKSLLVIKMEYFEGKNLKEWLRSLRDPQKRPDEDDDASKTLPWLRSQILLLFHRIAKVLQQIHEKDFVHRDLKPQNILVDSCGKVAICDFGLSKLECETVSAAGDCHDTNKNCGTPDYHAPEVATSGHSKQTDIYALGLIFLEMLTIYGGATESEKIDIFKCHKAGEGHKMGEFEKETGLIKRMLAKEPGTRCSLSEAIKCKIFSDSHRCNICGTDSSGLHSFEDHMNGRRHKLNLDKYRRGELKVPPPPKATSAAVQTPNRRPPSASRQQHDIENCPLVAEVRELRLENEELRETIYQLRRVLEISTNSLLENGIVRINR